MSGEEHESMCSRGKAEVWNHMVRAYQGLCTPVSRMLEEEGQVVARSCPALKAW